MAKDPAFLFYPGDFNTGTQFFTDEQVGKYMRLLMAQHQHGHLTENQVIFICKSYDKEVMSKFKKDSAGLWYNERLEIESNKRKKFIESRSKNKEGKTKEKIISKSYDPHMENKDINEDCIPLIKKESSKLEIFESLFTDAKYVEQLNMTHQGKDIKQAFEECYTHHSNAPNPPQELWEWRQKLNTWLTIKKTEKQNGTTHDKRNAATIARRQAFAERHGSGSTGG